jgi:hypothetical protein
MSKDIIVFIYGAIGGLLAFLTILLFKRLIRMGRNIHRSVFITTLVLLMAICGLAGALAVNSGLLLIVILTLSMGAIGAIISLIVSLVLYSQKETRM